MSRSSKLAAAISVLLAPLSTACDAADDADVGGAQRASARATQSALEADRVVELLAVLDAHEGVVTGVVDVRSSAGELLGTRTVTNHPVPAQISELLEKGGSDEQGFAYYDVTGARGDGELEVRYRYIRRHESTAPRAQDEAAEADSRHGTDERALSALIAEPEAPEEVEVYVRLDQPFSTVLKAGSPRV